MKKVTNRELIERCTNFNCIKINPCPDCPYYNKECALFQSEVNKAPFMTNSLLGGFGDFDATDDWLDTVVVCQVI